MTAAVPPPPAARPGPPLRVVVMASVRWYNAAAAYAVDLAEGLAGRGHAVRLVVKPGSPVEREGLRRGLDLVRDIDLTSLRPADVLAHVVRLRRRLLAFAPDVVNPHRSEDHVLAALALRGSAIPLVRTRGDVRPPRTGPANRLLYVRATRAHVATSDFMPDRFYSPLGIDPRIVAVIRPGVDLPSFLAGAPGREEARRLAGLDAAPAWIGLVGRFTAVKGHAVLLEAFARAAGRAGRPLRLLCSGEENEVAVASLRERARGLGIEGATTFRGRVPDARVLLRALDALVVPSTASEAISRVALEGLALGVPVVAARTNSLPEIVGDAGLLVPPGDPEALAEGLLRAVTDPGFAARAAEAGPARIRARYDRTRQLELTERIFRGCRPGQGGR